MWITKTIKYKDESPRIFKINRRGYSEVWQYLYSFETTKTAAGNVFTADILLGTRLRDGMQQYVALRGNERGDKYACAGVNTRAGRGLKGELSRGAMVAFQRLNSDKTTNKLKKSLGLCRI